MWLVFLLRCYATDNLFSLAASSYIKTALGSINISVKIIPLVLFSQGDYDALFGAEWVFR